MLYLTQDIGHRLRLHEMMAGGVQITVIDNSPPGVAAGQPESAGRASARGEFNHKIFSPGRQPLYSMLQEWQVLFLA